MGTLIYFVNHDLKEWICPVAKWGEFIGTPYYMVIVFEVLRDRWNDCRIEIMTEYDVDDIKNYKELDWDELLEYYKD